MVDRPSPRTPETTTGHAESAQPFKEIHASGKHPSIFDMMEERGSSEAESPAKKPDSFRDRIEKSLNPLARSVPHERVTALGEMSTPIAFSPPENAWSKVSDTAEAPVPFTKEEMEAIKGAHEAYDEIVKTNTSPAKDLLVDSGGFPLRAEELRDRPETVIQILNIATLATDGLRRAHPDDKPPYERLRDLPDQLGRHGSPNSQA